MSLLADMPTRWRRFTPLKHVRQQHRHQHHDDQRGNERQQDRRQQ
jgi:hypothetical protein